MAILTNLKKNVPADLQATPEFNIFLKLIRQKKFKDKKAAMMFLNQEMKHCKEFIKKFKSAPETMRRKRVTHTRRIKTCRLFKTKFMRYI